MGDMIPKGAILVFNGEERHLFWDFGVIEKVQELYGEHPYFAIIKMLWEGKTEDGTLLQHYQAKPLLDLAEILLNNEIAREKYFDGKSSLKKYTREELGMLIDRSNAHLVVAAIIASWRDSIGPANDDEEEEEKNLTSG